VSRQLRIYYSELLNNSILLNIILIYSSKTNLDKKHIGLWMNKLCYFKDNFCLLKHSDIKFSLSHCTVLSLFNLTILFRSESFKMLSGHHWSFFKYSFVPANQSSDINQNVFMCVCSYVCMCVCAYVCDLISVQAHFLPGFLLTGIYYQSIRQSE
jgi:hypothetical protein